MKNGVFYSALFLGVLPVYSNVENTPNVLMIVCDQLRYDCLGYTGNTIVKTPNIDKLAEEGVQFLNAYTPIPTSCPARQCLLSGRWPEQPSHGGLWNYDNSLPVRNFEGDTWTEKLHEKGYKLGYVGKWHVSALKSPLSFGFDDYISNAEYKKWVKTNKIQQGKIFYNQQDNKWMGGYVDMIKENNIVYWYKDRVVDLIKKYKSEGAAWHVRLDYLEPHLPCFPIKSFYDKYSNLDVPKWGNFEDSLAMKPYIQYQQLLNWGIEDYSWGMWENYLRSYFAIIEQVDDALGLLFKELEEIGALDNTIVIFTADHGDAAGSHRMLDKHYVMYEEEVHVPLLVKWDNVIKPNSTCDKYLIHFLDIAETMNDLFGLNFNTSGKSILPILKGENVKEWRRFAFSNYNGQQYGLYVQRMIKDDNYKYVWNLTDIDEFYDLKNDPNELKNLIYDKKYDIELKRLRKELYYELIARKDPIVGKPTAAYRQLIEQKKK